jgi:hypothetical protein
VIREPDVDMLVPVAEAVLGKRVMLERPPRRDGEAGEHRESDYGDDEICAHRVTGHGTSQAFRKAARLKERAPVALGAAGGVGAGCLARWRCL